MPKGSPLTDEQKAKMAAGRKAAAERKAAAVVEPEAPEPVAEPVVTEPEPDGPLLSDGELERIRQEARKKIDEEIAARNEQRKKQAIKDTLDAEILRQRREAGLTDHRDDMLEILIDVGPFTDRIVIDGTIYQHGSWYTVDRRKYDVMREIMARSWDAEERAGNPNRKFRREVAGTMNPMLRELRKPDGTLTMGTDTRVNGLTGAARNLPSMAQ